MGESGEGRQMGQVTKMLGYVGKGSWGKGNPDTGLEKFRVEGDMPAIPHNR